jgi:diaminopimelate decarboxylase
LPRRRALIPLLASSGLETPVYFYDLDAIAHEARALIAGYGRTPHLIAYALKANTAGSVVRTLAAQGVGADVVSAAELEVALACGIPANKIVMSGVAKKDAEIDLAIASGLLAIQAESVEELLRRARALGANTHASASVSIPASKSIRTRTSRPATTKPSSASRVPMSRARSSWSTQPATSSARLVYRRTLARC